MPDQFVQAGAKVPEEAKKSTAAVRYNAEHPIDEQIDKIAPEKFRNIDGIGDHGATGLAKVLDAKKAHLNCLVSLDLLSTGNLSEGHSFKADNITSASVQSLIAAGVYIPEAARQEIRTIGAKYEKQIADLEAEEKKIIDDKSLHERLDALNSARDKLAIEISVFNRGRKSRFFMNRMIIKNIRACSGVVQTIPVGMGDLRDRLSAAEESYSLLKNDRTATVDTINDCEKSVGNAGQLLAEVKRVIAGQHHSLHGIHQAINAEDVRFRSFEASASHLEEEEEEDDDLPIFTKGKQARVDDSGSEPPDRTDAAEKPGKKVRLEARPHPVSSDPYESKYEQSDDDEPGPSPSSIRAKRDFEGDRPQSARQRKKK